MKHNIIISFISLLPFISHGQTDDTTSRFAFALNSSVTNELYAFRLIPSINYSIGQSQLEFGIGVNPAGRQNQKLLSADFNYKYYPNGNHDKYNMYFITSLSYVNNTRNLYYPTRYHYLFANAGYGFEVNPIANLFMSTNISIATFTFSKNSEIPYAAFKSKKMFDEFGYGVVFQFNVGYRF